jgi:ABC-type microcin C transport system permease subunit YejE
MSLWQLVDQTLRTVLLIVVVAFIVLGTLEALLIVAGAAERDEIDD